MRVVAIALGLTAMSAASVRAQTAPDLKDVPECSEYRTNETCKVFIDRSNPVSPPTIQMYEDQQVYVVVVSRYQFEQYSLDKVTLNGSSAPDVPAALFQGIQTPLGGLVFAGHVTPFDTLAEMFRPNQNQTPAPGQEPPPAWDKNVPCRNLPLTLSGSGSDEYNACVDSLEGSAAAIYGGLEPFLAPDTIFESGREESHIGSGSGDITRLKNIGSKIDQFLVDEKSFATSVSALSGADDAAAAQQIELTDVKTQTHNIALDLAGFLDRIRRLSKLQNEALTCDSYALPSGMRGNGANCHVFAARRDQSAVYPNASTRTATYNVTALNLVAVSTSSQALIDPSKKYTIATLSIAFADNPKRVYGILHFEISAGIFFSTMPNRVYAATPKDYDSATHAVVDEQVTEVALRPTVVPFAALNWRLLDLDLPWLRNSNWLAKQRWFQSFRNSWFGKSSVYLTVGAGINPTTKVMDVALGGSISIRSLMLNVLAHYGHETSLADNFTVHEALGPDFGSTVPTQTAWHWSFAVGLSVRIPSLIGR